MVENFNETIKNSLKDIASSVKYFLDRKTNDFIKTLIVEDYVSNEIYDIGLPILKNWWIGKANNNKKEKFAIKIDDTIKDIDNKFANELKKDGYRIIQVVINQSKQLISFNLEGKSFSLEEIVTYLGLEEKERIENIFNLTRDNITNNIIDSIYKDKANLENFVYTNLVEEDFIFKYFNYCSNFDLVWANEIDGKLQFFIGEIKLKNPNEQKTFWMNVGERINYLNISKNTNIKVVAMALMKNKTKNVFETLLKGYDWPIFYHIFTSKELQEAKVFEGCISEHDRMQGKKATKVVEFSYDGFERFIDGDIIGRNISIQDTLNSIIKRKVDLFKKIPYEKLQKHYGKLYVLYYLMINGYDIDYRDYINEKNIDNDILLINGHKVLFKYMESSISWNVMLKKSLFEIYKKEGIDSIVVYRNSNKSNKLDLVKDTSLNCYLLKNFNENTINILGILSLDDFDKLKHMLPANIESCQTNLNKAKKGFSNFVIKKVAPIYSEPCYFVQIDTNLDYCPVDINLNKINKYSKIDFAKSFFEK